MFDEAHLFVEIGKKKLFLVWWVIGLWDIEFRVAFWNLMEVFVFEKVI